MRVLIVTGGMSDERNVSLKSAENVIVSLRKKNYEVEQYDITNGYTQLLNECSNIDVLFPVLHGVEGEGGDLQEFCEKNNLPFVGSGPAACRRSWNKVTFKEFCDENGIQTAEWFILSPDTLSRLDSFFPAVIKPEGSGSSIDIKIVKEKKDLTQVNVKELFSKYEELLVEKFISGIEVTVGVLGEEVLPVIEIKPPERGWFDYENKYNGKTQEIPNAPSLTDAQRKEVQEIALKIHRSLDCRHFSRSDFILGKDGRFYALELNTIPGLTSESLLPKAAKAAGISFDEMIDRLVKMAVE